MLHAGLDMDPSSVMFLTAMMQTAGVTNTKSGTWLRSFFERAAPPMDDTPASLKRLGALERMGLADDSRHQTWTVLGSDGKTDWDKSILKLSEIINKWGAKTDPIERIATLQAAFGERGGGFAALMNLPQFIAQFPVLEQKMKAFQGGGDVLDFMAKNSPIQQFHQAWSDFQNVMMDVGAIALPPVVSGLQGLDAALNAIGAAIKTVPFLGNFINGPGLIKGAGSAALDLLGAGVSPASAAGRTMGRDPHSPSSGPYAYTPPAAPVTVAAPQVDVKSTTTVTLDGASIAAAIVTRVKKMVESALRLPTSSAGFDGRTTNPVPDSYNF
jgi:hypothetical protein